MRKKKVQHVMPNIDEGWSVYRSGSSRASRIFDTKKEAVKYGRVIAKSQGSTLVIHSKDGRIEESKKYAEPVAKRVSGQISSNANVRGRSNEL